jgi:serine/threonine protein kinase
MIHNYSKEQLLGGSGERKGYRVSRNGRDYFMEEYSLFNISHENTYKLKSRLAKSTHLLPLLEQFEHQDRHYFVYEYTEDSLQSYMSRKEGRMLHPSEALKFYASLVEFADSCHEQMFLLRAFNPARIRVRKDSILFYDLTAGVQMKKRRKLFENINSHYIAPECLSEDGYSQEVDVWAGGVLLYYMLTGAYPFQVEGKSTLEIQQ